MLVTPQMTFLRLIHSGLWNTDHEFAGRPVPSNIHPGDKNGDWYWMEVEMTDMLDDPDVRAIVLNNRNISRVA